MQKTHRLTLALIALLAVPAGVLAQQQGEYPLPSGPAASPGGGSPAEPPLKPLSPKPALRRAAVLDRVRGVVRFRLPGEDRYRRLTGPTSVPMRTIVDTTDGRVRLTVARDRRGRTSKGVFYDGRFRLAQGAGKRPITHLRLVGEFETACASAQASASAAARRKRRRLWGDGKGRFRTRGRYSAATVRGTKWLVEDRCDGTLTKVARGEVEVVDFAPEDTAFAPDRAEGENGSPAPAMGGPAAPRKSRKVRVTRGGSYVARPGG
jgi:hypothetical protein